MSSIFSSFVKHPHNAKYDGEDHDEKILYVFRRSPITNFRWILILGGMILAPLVVDTLLIIISTQTVEIPHRLLFSATLFWYLATFGYAFQSFLNWFFNVYIISNKKIVDMDFYGLLYKNISDAPLRNVEDVTSTVSGALQTIFNYGSVVVQTSAEKREFEFEEVSNPSKVRDLISDLVMEVRRGR